MEKYKICPNCGEKNDPSLMECSNCGEELFQVGITDPKTIIDPPDDSPHRLVKYCDCGAVNPPNARKCESCGEDISDISPEPERNSTLEEKSIRLFDTDGNELYKMNKGTVISIPQQQMVYMIWKARFIKNFEMVFIIINIIF